MIAPVISIADLRDARARRVDTRTQTQRLNDVAHAEAHREAFLDGFCQGLQKNLISVGAPMVEVLRPRPYIVPAQTGGWAS